MNDYDFQPSNRRKTAHRSHSTQKKPRFLRHLICYIIPFLVLNSIIFFLVTSSPSMEISIGETSDYQSTEVTLHITSLLPTRNLTLALDSEPLVLTKKSGKIYTVTITQNGVLEAYVENFNGMAASVFQQVDNLDDAPPTVESFHCEDGTLSFQITDSQSGVDYDNLYGLDAEGTRLLPKSIDKATGTITFDMGEDDLVIHMNDLSGHEATVTFHSNNTAEESTVAE